MRITKLDNIIDYVNNVYVHIFVTFVTSSLEFYSTLFGIETSTVLIVFSMFLIFFFVQMSR